MMRSTPRSLARTALAASLLACLAAAGNAQLLGPSAYLQASDSPFAGLSFGTFYLEDFEDHLLNVPGVTPSAGGVTSVVFGPEIHDSVDADDGAIDGSGLQGDDWFSSGGTGGVTWTFDASVLGALPTHAGIVWTDGANDIFFEAFDENGVSLGTRSGTHANPTITGETDDDYFYGAINPGGISKIHIHSGVAGIELDHLQYGVEAVPEPASIAALAVGIAAMLRRRRA
ncbi:PEP-CTERM sorting domain-containing protein [bacterium]|nr:MAG: PEP-CTERM sorting domain-containing protein [bacterium]